MRALKLFALVCAFLFGLGWLNSGMAQPLRTIPAGAKKVEMTFTGHFSRVIVDEKSYVLSPGAQIRDIHNRLVLPSHIRGKYKVRVKLNNQGAIHRIWMLTPQEAAVRDPDEKDPDEEKLPEEATPLPGDEIDEESFIEAK